MDTLVRGGALQGDAESFAGGKAHGLARLLGAGANVPAFFVVTAQGFAAHYDGGGGALGAELVAALDGLAQLDPRTQLAELERGAEAVRSLIERTPLDPALAASVAIEVAALGSGPFAVRSSMVGEDSASHSFAGQLDTYLFQRAEDIPVAIVRCWASAFTTRALVYRARAGTVAQLPKVGVVVQRMITGRVSGVLFTANPINGRRDQAMISGCWGAGEGVVSGQCACDELVYGHDGRELSLKVADKDTHIVRRSDGPGTMEAEVPEALRNVRCITAEEATALVREGLRVAEAFGGPQDIEWTIDDQLYLLQARPITTLGGVAERAQSPADAPPEPHGPEIVWDNSNIQESYCGVTTPLTFSFALNAYGNVYEQIMRIARLPEADIARERPVLQNLLGLLEGRVYYNINNWYRMLLHLPSFKQNKHDMEKMMGLEEPVDFVVDTRQVGWAKAKRIVRLVGLGLQLVWRFRRMDTEVARFIAEFDTAYGRIDGRRAEFPKLTISELRGLLRTVDEKLLGRWHTPILNDLYVMTTSGRIRRFVERSVGADRAPALLANLMGGEEGIESTEPTRQLLKMSARARTHPGLRAALLDPGATLQSLRGIDAQFTAALDSYIARYGDRCMGELKLETVSLREDPSFLVRLLRNYLDRGELDADAIAEKEKQLRQEAEAELKRASGRLPTAMLNAARSAVKYRENMRLLRTRMFGLVRDLYRAIGDRMAAVGRLDAPRDIFYLTIQEVEAYCAGTAVTADTAGLARLRKAEFAAYGPRELPHRLVTRGPVYHGNRLGEPLTASGVGGARLLKGTGCYPGVVEAPARIILNPTDDIDLAGKLLVTLRTDPGWAPLFPLARGILVERGSTLSHSAILARELGIPAVVGVPNLLKTVRDGETLRIDGSTGTVERLEAE